MLRGKAINPIALIRNFDCSSQPDGDLVDRLRFLSNTSNNSEKETFETYAIISEIIDRRLGIWKVFDPATVASSLTRYHQFAKLLTSKAPYKNHISYYRDPEFLNSKSFSETLEPILNQWRLNSTEKAVVKTLVYVGEQSDIPTGNLYLSGDFYQSLRKLDVENVHSFHVTDSQFMAALMVYQGSIIELDAGEGKTISAAIPAIIHALNGRSVHIITSNDYLARRDCELLSAMYDSIGLSSGFIQSHMEPVERQHVYQRDIVYSTIREIGFDFLRDNLKTETGHGVLNTLEVALVDEADHTLIDQALSPLILSGAPIISRRAFKKSHQFVKELLYLQKEVVNQLEIELTDSDSKKATQPILAKLALADPRNYLLKDKIIDKKLRKIVSELLESISFDQPSTDAQDLYFIVEPDFTSVTMTQKGQELLQRRLGDIFEASPHPKQLSENLTSSNLASESYKETSRHTNIQHSKMNQVYQLIRAYILLRKNVDYVVTDGQIVLVDQMTGRTLTDNRYQHDLHAALEAKENVEILDQHETLAQISIPGLMSKYSQVAGLTGTALNVRGEFARTYGLSVNKIPSALKSLRVDRESQVLSTRFNKINSIIQNVKSAIQVGRPVLIGTNSVDESSALSSVLANHDIDHMLLNAVHDSQEATVVEQAGKLGSVTIATNIAGRGTDIIVQPDLDKIIVSRYEKLIGDIFNNGSSRIDITCGSESEAYILMETLSQPPHRYRIEKNFSSPYLKLTVALHPINRLSYRSSKPLTYLFHKNPVQFTLEFCGSFMRSLINKFSSLKNWFSENIKRLVFDKPIITSHLDFGLGMLVIGTELNKSRRIDDQLRGRTARQGSYGTTKFVLSLKDLSPVKYGSFRITDNYSNHKNQNGTSWQISKIEKLQTIMEQEDEFDRAFSQNYWQVMDNQTFSYYDARRKILESSLFQNTYLEFAEAYSKRLVDRYFPKMRIRNYQNQFWQMSDELENSLGLTISNLHGSPIPSLAIELTHRIIKSIDEVNVRLNPERVNDLGKMVFLQTADKLWKDHMTITENLFQSFSSGTDGIATSMAKFKICAFQEYCEFKKIVTDQFLCNLLSSPIREYSDPQKQSVQVSTDVSSMLEITSMNHIKMEAN